MSDILKAFNEACKTYDQHALVQRHVAQKLSAMLESISPAPQRILEIGCGTGFLTKIVHTRHPHALYFATDFAPAMVFACQKKIGHHVLYSVMDGEKLCMKRPVDWIISNLTFQWFHSFKTSLEQIWKHTSMLAFTTLVEGTFLEWSKLYEQAGLQDGLISMISSGDLYDICQSLKPSKLTLNVAREQEHYANTFAFIRSLKSIGAATSRPGYGSGFKPKMPPEGLDITYQVAYCILQR